MVEQRERREGRFFGRRVNCESVPSLPAWIVGQVLDDPRKIPYLLVWRSCSNGTAREAVRIAACNETNCPDALYWLAGVEIKRHDGARDFIRTLLRPLPRNGGRDRLLICPYCNLPRRALYGWEVDHSGRYTTSSRICSWQCRACAELRYESEGGGLVHRGRGALCRMMEAALGPMLSERTKVWYPDVFTSPRQAADVGLCNLLGN